MGIVTLEGMEFFAYHGFYEEEQKIGNRYSLDIVVSSDFEKAAVNDDLTGTINYEILYRIVKEEMAKPTKLLEHLAQRIIDQTYTYYPAIEWVEVSVSKFNPPIGGVCARSKIILRK
jgi:dihydroneopterin aldolase